MNVIRNSTTSIIYKASIFTGTISPARIPRDPETMLDPKECLLRLALRAPRRRREDLVIEVNGNVRQGPGYNPLLSEFAGDHWSASNAALHAHSLQRAIRCVTMLPELVPPE